MRADPLFPDELAGELNMPIVEVAAGKLVVVSRVLTRTVRPRRFIVHDTAAAGSFLIDSIEFGVVEQFAVPGLGVPAEIFSPTAFDAEIPFDTIRAGLRVSVSVRNIAAVPHRFRCAFMVAELPEADRS